MPYSERAESAGALAERALAAWRSIALHAAAATVIIAVLLPGLRDVPVSRDDGVYLHIAHNVQEWLQALATSPRVAISDDGVQRYWGENHEHPSVARLLAAGPSLVLRSWLDPIVSMRLGGALLAVLLVLDAFHFMRRYFGTAAATFAAPSILLIPCVYGHACIAAMDFPAAALGLLATTAFVRGTERPVWALLFGVYMGLALNAKINAAFVPLPLILWAFVYRRQESTLNLFALLVVTPAIWVLTWPWLWHDTAARLLEYLSFHLHHHQGNSAFFGNVYADQPPPWLYPIVYLIVSVPVPILLPALAGVAAMATDLARRRPTQPELVLLLAGLVTPVLVSAVPNIPKYNGPRLFLGAFPFVACLAGVGFSRVLLPVALRLSQRWQPGASRLVACALGATLLIPAAVVTARVHPFEPYSYYNSLVGGTTGAFRLGLSSVHWGMANLATVEYLNRHGGPGDVLYDNTGASVPLRAYQAEHKLRSDFRWGKHPDWVVLEYNLAYSNWYDWWMFYEDRHPRYERVLQIEAAGAPVLGVFRVRAEPVRDASGKIIPTLVVPPESGQQAGATP